MRCLVATLVATLVTALVVPLVAAVALAPVVGPAGPAYAATDEPAGVWPLDPEPDVTRGFEPPPGPWAAGHRGVDLTVTDSHCFPAACLHWGLIRGTGDTQEYLDPLTLVGSGPVRLLPLWRDEPVTARLPWAPPLEAWRRPVDWLA